MTGSGGMAGSSRSASWCTSAKVPRSAPSAGSTGRVVAVAGWIAIRVLLPGSLELVADEDGQRVHPEDHHEQNDDGGCRGRSELLLRLGRAGVDLKRKRGELAHEAVRVEADRRSGADQQQGGSITDRTGEAENRPGRDPRHGRGKGLAPGGLPLRGTE